MAGGCGLGPCLGLSSLQLLNPRHTLAKFLGTLRNETRSITNPSITAPLENGAQSQGVTSTIIIYIVSALCILLLAMGAILLGWKLWRKRHRMGAYQPNNEKEVRSWKSVSSNLKIPPEERLI
uniref:Uncharacterized protein n=1 Tax=Vombatus ursinus TaxID=29139 RepID=A0A4X2JXC7_VOMUR